MSIRFVLAALAAIAIAGAPALAKDVSFELRVMKDTIIGVAPAIELEPQPIADGTVLQKATDRTGYNFWTRVIINHLTKHGDPVQVGDLSVRRASNGDAILTMTIMIGMGDEDACVLDTRLLSRGWVETEECDLAQFGVEAVSEMWRESLDEAVARVAAAIIIPKE